ncbi:hypothetical protein LMG29542_07238 [Paraburkholderia humisilvae]|uniref:Uncharacterized protein n=1 Tax=Paraburkholderia humisilvae TaxID=627669 RepID=A0A6J5F6Q8_9BURK|nr:hypothetical protein LMG29542_07238 [Paraburkholderia humisilvae]
MDDELRVVAILARAVRFREGRQFKPAAEFDQHLLERPALAGRRHDGHAHRVDRSVEFGDRPVEHRHRVVALEVSRIRQDQIRERGHLRLERIAHDDKRNLVFAVLVPVGEHLAHFDGIHRRVPCHVRHEDHQCVDRIRVAAPCIRNHAMHQPVHRERVFPRERLVDAHRAAACVDEQVFRRGRPTERSRRERRIRLDRVRAVRRFRRRRHRARERRFVAKAAGPIDRTKQRHQHRECTNRLKAVRMRSEATHRVKRDRIAGHRFMGFAPRIGPANRQRNLVIARRVGHLARETPDRVGGNASDLRSPFGRALCSAFAQQRERWRDRRTVIEHVIAFRRALERRLHPRRVVQHGALAFAIPPQMVLRKQRIAFPRIGVAHEQAEFVALLIHVQQVGRVRKARDELVIETVGGEQFVNQRHEQRTIGAGTDRHPFIGNRRIAGTHRIDRDETASRALEFRNRNLEWIRMVVFGGADHQKQLCAVEIRAAEFPERPADGIDHAGRHVGRAEAAVRRVVRRAVLLREQAGQRLHLVTPGEERELLRVGRAQMRKTLFERL